MYSGKKHSFQEASSFSCDPSSRCYGDIESQDSLEEVLETSNEYSNLYTSQQIEDIIAEDAAAK